jgi:hypothetical protein
MNPILLILILNFLFLLCSLSLNKQLGLVGFWLKYLFLLIKLLILLTNWFALLSSSNFNDSILTSMTCCM